MFNPDFYDKRWDRHRLSVRPARTLLRGVQHPKNLNRPLPDTVNDEIRQARNNQFARTGHLPRAARLRKLA